MPFNHIADPAQLKLLRDALDQHCSEVGVDASDAPFREAIAGRIIYLFQTGVGTVEELKQALRSDHRL